MPRDAKEREFALVVRGIFNPKMFLPSWFERTKLLRPGEAEKADVKIAHSSVVDFILEWGRMQVTADRFSFVTRDEGHECSVLDLVSGTFKSLPSTPVNAVGINRLVHFSVTDETEWHGIGHKLVPKAGIWDELLKEPGMLSLTVQGKQDGERPGSTNVRIEPSQKFKPGIYLDVNDHYQIRDGEGKEGCGADLVELLKTLGKESSRKTRGMVDALMEKL